MSQVVEPIIGPVGDGSPVETRPVRVPRLARHQITLKDGHTVGIAVAGRGVPLVVVHGFSAEGFLYAQTLSRLVSMGFKVIAIDTAGHGGTAGLPSDGQSIDSYSELLGRVIDELGIRHCILAGHSMGGRLVTQLAAERPGPHDRRAADRRDRRRHLGPDGLPVPNDAAAAAARRHGAWWSTPPGWSRSSATPSKR